MRRSRKKGQLRRVSSLFVGSHSATRISSEFNAGIACGRISFIAHAIDDRDKRSVRDSMRALHGAPSIELRRSEFSFFLRVPADAGRIENNLCALQRGQPRSFRVPLVPTNLNSDAAVFGIEIWKTEIAGREIKFFVI